jgi:FSR family fosmidomycin resistance protein-like MFS transporter
LVGTTADFRRFGPRRSLPLNDLPGENRRTLGRIGEVGLISHVMAVSLSANVLNRRCPAVRARSGEGPRTTLGFPLLLTIGVIDSATRMGFLTFLPFLLQWSSAG